MSLTSPVTNTNLYVPPAALPAHYLTAPFVKVNIDDGFLNLMSADGSSKDDVRIPESDLGKQIADDFEAGKDLLVTIISAMGEEQAISVKETPKGN